MRTVPCLTWVAHSLSPVPHPPCPQVASLVYSHMSVWPKLTVLLRARDSHYASTALIHPKDHSDHIHLAAVMHPLTVHLRVVIYQPGCTHIMLRDHNHPSIRLFRYEILNSSETQPSLELFGLFCTVSPLTNYPTAFPTTVVHSNSITLTYSANKKIAKTLQKITRNNKKIARNTKKQQEPNTKK